MDINTVGDVRVALLVHRFDAYSSKEVEGAFSDLIQSGCTKLVCDFSGTEYIASAGLRVLLSTAKGLQKAGGQIALCSLKPYVYEVFETAGFTQIFRIYDSQDQAVGSL